MVYLVNDSFFCDLKESHKAINNSIGIYNNINDMGPLYLAFTKLLWISHIAGTMPGLLTNQF